MKKEILVEKQFCCGCEACVNICPKHCISFEEDEEGFRYPSVNAVDCIDCGLCEKVCPFKNPRESKLPLDVYAAKNNNETELLSSSSGGLFICFAKEIIKEGGVVFGARFNENWEVIHSYTENLEGLSEFMGSKYVQSRIGNTYLEAKRFLQSGRKVLFTGTSCQIAGLHLYLQKEYDNLFTIDIICHGVPSPKVWRRYVTELKGKSLGGQIKKIYFRDKKQGWKDFSFKVSYGGSRFFGLGRNEMSHHFLKDPYMLLFLGNHILRPSCFHCQAKNGKSGSDLTIADFWGIEKCQPELYDKRGVGLLLVNNEKGKKFLDGLELSMHKVTLEEAIARNPFYTKPVKEPEKRKQCFQIINESNMKLKKVLAHLFPVPLSIRIKRNVKSILKK